MWCGVVSRKKNIETICEISESRDACRERGIFRKKIKKYSYGFSTYRSHLRSNIEEFALKSFWRGAPHQIVVVIHFSSRQEY